jgi:serine/threonine-protein kinase
MGPGTDPRAEQRVGAVLDEKWTLENLLGAGGMGAVYLARHRNGARAAVKILHPELARQPEVRERFLREGYAANRVEHRGAVQVLDDDIVKSGPDEGSAYIVMELLEGESLQERVNRAPKLGETELLEVMDAVLDVLGAAHTHGVVHRDLKPENIFLADDPEREGVRVKVLDFGLARISEASLVTTAGIAVGTPSFMSPEQAAGRGDEIDGRTDIFALGATIFRIVTGRRIHDADNMVQLVSLMAHVPAPALRSIVPDVSERFARIVDRALAFDKADRYPDAEAMRADIRDVLDADKRGSVHRLVIPFSVRRAGSNADDAPTPEFVAPARPKADTNAAVTSLADEEREPSSHRERRPVAQSATLPWAIVLVLLAGIAWKLGPSLQQELVRRASLEPVRQLLATASSAASSATEPDPPTIASAEAPTASPLAEPAATPEADAAPAIEADDEDASVDDDVSDSSDGGDALPAPVASAAHSAPHPRPPQAPRAAKPPVKKAPAKKQPPWHPQPRKR